jgi:predicted RecA/RadA family phage recombinase
MSEASIYNDSDVVDVTTPAAGYASGEVIQLADGRAAYVGGLQAKTSGEAAGAKTSGQVTVTKTSGVVVLKGAPLYWDRSANTATPLKALAGGDFFLGVSLEDAASTATTVVVDLNVQPVYTIDALRDASATALVLTAGTPSLTMGPGYAKMAFSTTAEAQKVDILSAASVPVTVPFIVEGRINIVDSGDAAAAAVDINVGLANATHASDADSITESLFLHVDGADTNGAVNINAESDDGTTEVAATDTTVDFTAGTAFDFAFDCRDLTACKLYVNGVRVLSATAFKLDAATGPLKLLAHMEKGANDTAADVRIEKLAIRTTDLAS